MRKMITVQGMYDQLFFDETGAFITMIHENDANWRSEYQDSLMEHFGVEVEHKDYEDFVNKDKYNDMCDVDYDKANDELKAAVAAKLGKKPKAKKDKKS